MEKLSIEITAALAIRAVPAMNNRDRIPLLLPWEN
jgi:hypothetical protein